MQQHDPRTEKMKREMATHFAEYEQDYRDGEWCSIIYENNDHVLIADHKGYEHSEWRDEFSDVKFFQKMHTFADELSDWKWITDWPVIFDKQR